MKLSAKARCRSFYLSLNVFSHYNDVIMSTMTSQIKENTKVPRQWTSCGEFTGDRWIPPHKGPITRNVSIWWRHHDVIRLSADILTPDNAPVVMIRRSADLNLWNDCVKVSVTIDNLTPWSLGNEVTIFKVWFSNLLYWVIVWELNAKLLSGECYRISLIRSLLTLHWFRNGLVPPGNKSLREPLLIQIYGATKPQWVNVFRFIFADQRAYMLSVRSLELFCAQKHKGYETKNMVMDIGDRVSIWIRRS